MTTSPRTTDRLSRYLAACGIAVPLVFVALMALGGFLQEGYSHVSQAVSELGGVEADRPIVQNLNFVVTGLLVMSLALGLHRAVGQGGRSVAGPLLIGMFGLGTTVAQPLLPCDPGCDFVTLTGTMHNVTGMASFVALIVGIALTAGRFRESREWRAFATPSRITAAVALLALIAWIGVAKAAEVESLNGVLQRVFIGIALAWIGVAGVWLWRVSSDSGRRGDGVERRIVGGSGTAPTSLGPLVRACIYVSGGVSAVGIVLLVGFFASGIGALGTLNDVAVIAQYVLMLPIAVALHRAVRTTRPSASAASLVTGLAGMLGVVTLQALLVTGVVPFETQIGLVSAAFLVVLGWFLLVYRLGRHAGLLPGGLALHVMAGLYFGYPIWAFRLARRMS